MDTNILLRYLTQDNVKQAQRATEIFEKQISEDNRGFFSTVVLVETCWALGRFYKVEAKGIETMIDRFLVAPSVEFEHREEICKALRLSRTAPQRLILWMHLWALSA